MRPGVQSYTPNSDDRAFMELGVLLMCEMGDRLSSRGAAGKLESIIVNFAHDSVMLVDHGKGHLALSADRTDALRMFEEIRPMIGQLPV
jgi:predicted regulator of Ras-like GTPase activity (Roadblock/LC7/MglB family)